METKQLVLQQEKNPWVLNLVGRFHTENQLDTYKLLQHIPYKWNLSEGRLHISVIGSNLFVMGFKRYDDLKRILNEQPWEIDSHLLILKEFDNNQNPRNIEFTYVPLWFYFEGLCYEHYNQESIKHIAKAVGTVLSVDPEVGLTSFVKGFRARVDVHVLLPLPPGTFVRTLKNGLVWVSIIPERLPSTFCNKCFLLGHQEFACKTFHHQIPNELNSIETKIKTEKESYESFYSSPDPRMIYSSKGKRAFVDSVCNSGDGEKRQKCFVDESVHTAFLIESQVYSLVNFLEGKCPPTQKVLDQMFEYLSSSSGQILLQSLGLVLVSTAEVVDTPTDQFGFHEKVVTNQTLQLMSAINLMDSSSYQNDYVNNLLNNQAQQHQYLQRIVKKEEYPEPEEPSLAPGEGNIDNSWMDFPLA
ncbi:reverse transcriptase [Thalictrum thalictroides]|uniref:Reverse transcriptase n=1 Tax=Thalictrum thalictroides TaxID=46969 RepID=A0A7J6UQY7_THATH|nr:reverse transcriptase [Thalictrum thalictroides]